MSLRSPKAQGFQPLNPNITNESHHNMAYDQNDGIPLTEVRTNASSRSGARKPGGEPVDLSSANTYNEKTEKKGFFHSHSHGHGHPKNAGRRRKKSKGDEDESEESLTGLGRIYNKIINFSVVTRYAVYVVPVALLIAVPIIIYAVLNPRAILGSMNVRVWVFWTWIEIVWLSLWVSKLAAQAIPYVFMFLAGVVSSGTRKYSKVLQQVEIPLSLVGWAVTSLVTFTALMRPELNLGLPQKRWVGVMKNLLGPALIASLIFLAEKMVIQLISVNYHRRSFANRIQDSKRDVFLLGLLYDASRTLFPTYCPEFAEEDYIINDSIEHIIGKTVGGSKKSGSATPLRLIGNIGRVGDKVTSVFGNIASEITGKQVFNPTSAHSVVVEALEKTRSSEALARRLWMSFVCEGRDALYADDIEEVLGPARKDEAEEAFASLDNDGNGNISLEEMIMKVVDISRDRKAIASSMRDVGQAIGVLDSVLCVVLFVIIVFIFVAFQNTNFITTLATAGTTLLSLSFVFAVSVQEFLGSCIFLFVKHPYDVGDRVDIAGPSGVEFLVVEQISLLYTVFKRIDNMKIVQVPNIVLNGVWVENVTRSKAMKEQLEMFISFDTTLEDIDLLRKEMENFVRHSDNARDFQPDILLEATGIGNMDKLQLRIEIRHKSNWHNETIRAARRSKFMCALVLALRKVPIYAPGGGGEALGGPTNPGYTVAINDSWAIAAREKASKDKEAKRLVPTPKKDDGASTGKSTAVDGGGSENAAAASLNARRPGADSAHKDGDRQDDDTLSGRDTSLERQRSNDIDNLRQGLLKRESTRGKRRPGEAVPAALSPTDNAPALTLTQSSPRRKDTFLRSRGRQPTVDEENEVGSGYDTRQSYEAYRSRPSQDGYGTSRYAPGAGSAAYAQPSQTQQQQARAQAGQRVVDTYSAFPTNQMASGLGMNPAGPVSSHPTVGGPAPGNGGYQSQLDPSKGERERQAAVGGGFSNVPLGGGPAGQGSVPSRKPL